MDGALAAPASEGHLTSTGPHGPGCFNLDTTRLMTADLPFPPPVFSAFVRVAAQNRTPVAGGFAGGE